MSPRSQPLIRLPASKRKGARCSTTAALFIPGLQPFDKYQLSVLPDGPEVLSDPFFGSQPLVTEVAGEADVLRFTTAAVPATFQPLLPAFQGRIVHIERAVRPRLRSPAPCSVRQRCVCPR